ncbi:hypothetical protein CERZMDRAFT_109614 [Cercospora zeae-maydis SCOH1-5]|uniref:Uncharacterized protein n=1 Tax=Cercospora zeae-maydis SCOH1-5 TaxID=717836 RepID=A0A6A6FR06_9PEZI|nr:hypothetical protein CERZMDRAFT_109614 [Cercospora zeae-maydis SCOH1-5]
MPSLLSNGNTAQLSPSASAEGLEADKMMPIAVVGLGFRGPKDATTPEGLWRMIRERREAWTTIPKERWNNDAFYHPDNNRHGTINVVGGHFLEEDLAHFDAPFFNLTSAEASVLDPQQRLLLEVTYEAFENAGIPLEKVFGSKTSCFVGSFSGDYTDMLVRDPDCVPMYQCTNAGQSRAMTANRVSYFFDLKGQSTTVDTACSGSLVALHLACQSLRTGDAKVALAAGVNTVLSHEFASTMSMMRFLSPDGRCHTFDEKANGYARGEGVGCIVLKPLADALANGDPIRAIVRGSGSNSDGRTQGITLPSGIAQEQLIRDTYESAGLDPLDTEYVECHGTGTQAGDPQETSALARVFCDRRSADNPLRVGSIKTNVGHLEGASGIAGAIKGILMLDRKTLLPNRALESLNPRIQLDEWKLKIQLELEDWHTQGPRRVSVNSFGYGGSNAHIILEDAEGYLGARGLTGNTQERQFGVAVTNGITKKGHAHSKRQDSGHFMNGQVNVRVNRVARPRLFVLSAFDEVSGKKQIERLVAFLRDHDDTGDEWMNDLAMTLVQRRTSFMWKLAVPATTSQALAETLNAYPKFLRGNKKPTVGFVFTGQGAQWCGMGKELLDTYPVFSKVIDQIGTYLSTLGAPFDLRTELTSDAEGSKINLAIYSQPICSAVQIALVDLLRSWGIRPASVTGHSSGELAAAYAAGVLSWEDTMKAAYYRGLVCHNMRQAGTRQGAMMAVAMSENEVQSYLTALTRGVAVVACVNSPKSLTISGDLEAIDELQSVLDKEKIFARKLAVEMAYHSPHMAIVADEYRDLLQSVTPRLHTKAEETADENDVEFFSSVFGRKADLDELGAEYWVSNLLGQVKFADSLRLLCLGTTDVHSRGKARQRRKRAGAAAKVTVDILVEVGPHSALAGPIKQILKADAIISNSAPTYASALVRQSSAVTTALTLAGSLFSAGYPVDMTAINHTEDISIGCTAQPLVDLPPYPWNHSYKYWGEPRISKVYRNRKFPRTDLLGALDRNSSRFEPRWRNYIRLSEIPWVRDHRVQSNIVFPAAGYIAMALEAALQTASEQSDQNVLRYHLREITIGAAVILNEESPAEVITSLRPHNTSLGTNIDRWHHFSICSATADNRWTEHCSGLIRVQLESAAHEIPNGTSDREGTNQACHQGLENAHSSCPNVLDTTNFYQHLSAIGFDYGGSFARMSTARTGPSGSCVAEVKIPDTAATMPMGFEYPLTIHPCALDAVFHSIFAALSSDKLIEDAAVPTFIKSIEVASQVASKPDDLLRVFTTARYSDAGHIAADLVVYDGAPGVGASSVSVDGLQLTVLGSEQQEDNGDNGSRTAYQLEWQPDPDFVSPDQVASILLTEMPAKAQRPTVSAYETVAAQNVSAALQVVHLTDIPVDAPQLRQMYERLCSLNESANRTEAETPSSIQSSAAEGAIVATIGKHLPEILLGQIDTRRHILDCGALELYRSSQTPHLSSLYGALARYLALLGHRDPHMSVIEINAGKGSGTLRFLEALNSTAPAIRKYTVTDTSNEDFVATEELLQPWKSLVQFSELDIDRDIEEQNFEKHSYDVVIMAHSTLLVKNMVHALRRTRRLLKPNGKLVLVDIVIDEPSLVQTMVLGSLPTSWADGSSRVPSMQQWKDDLLQSGFSGPQFCVQDSGLDLSSAYSLMVANASDVSPTAHKAPEILLIDDDKSPGRVAELLKLQLENSGCDVQTTALANAPVSSKLCIVLLDLTSTVLGHPNSETWESIKNVFLHSAGVLWVGTGCGVDVVNPNAALVTGLARTARSETGDHPIVTLDISEPTSRSPEAVAGVILKLFQRRFVDETFGADTDTEYAERDGVLLIPRVAENEQMNEDISSLLGKPAPVDQLFHTPERCLQATIGTVGQPGTILFADAESSITTLPPDHVEIEVAATGLNKEDLDMVFMAGSRLEDAVRELCGTVSAVGKDVSTFDLGDQVACIGLGSISNKVQVHSTHVHKLPNSLTMNMAAGMLAAYCSAYYTVHHLAQVVQDDTVLIHNATAPNSQAIMELCGLAGATIIAAVDSVAQKAMLRGRFKDIPDGNVLVLEDEAFPGAVHRLTDGSGFDVVFNTFQPTEETHRLSWESLAPCGRFIDLSGSKLTNGNYLEMGKFAKDANYSAFSFARLVTHKRDTSSRILARVLELFRLGVVKGIYPLKHFDIANLGVAMQEMHAQQSADKFVVTARHDSVVKAVPEDKSHELLRPDASYLLIGGLGGIGRATAMWMVAHGARNIIFANRSGMARAEASQTVEALQAKGARAVVFSCDVGDKGQVDDLVAKAAMHMPPIKGVLQGAMVLRDAMLEKMTVQEYNTVLQPKFQGTWNLHNALPKDLDFFVMLSSISGIIGNASQAAYAAGNSFMDAFAAYRNAQGLPAVTLDLGVIAGIGYLAENKELAVAMAAQGFAATDETKLMALVHSAMRHPCRNGPDSQVITGLGTWSDGHSLGNFDAPLFAKFRRMGLGRSHGGEASSTEEIRHALRRAVDLDEATAIICSALIEKLASRLGVAATNVLSDKNIAEYGVDSLVGVEVRNWIAKELDAQVPMLEILANQSLLQLAGKIASKSKSVKIVGGADEDGR